jgi:anthranilate phosphoribosyltransferase
MIKEMLNKVLNNTDLSFEESKQLMDDIMGGELSPVQIGAMLIALRMKKESINEISGMALSMRNHASTINPGGALIDTCGTGGDLSGTFNISTTAAFIVAGCGLKIAKHGNRSVSSKCGSADLLESLGVNINLSPQQVEQTIKEVGIGFMFAPKFHGAMKHAIGPRKELAVRTVFNILGPLTNPANAQYQLLGVFDESLTETMANVLKKLGTKKALIVHGHDGLDEISICGPTKVSELKISGEITTYDINPTDFGIALSDQESIKGGDLSVNTTITKDILSGKETGPKRDISILNAAGALVAANKAADFSEGIKMARDAISSKKSQNILELFIKKTNSFS